jgi:hypothetical protein
MSNNSTHIMDEGGLIAVTKANPHRELSDQQKIDIRAGSALSVQNAEIIKKQLNNKSLPYKEHKELSMLYSTEGNIPNGKDIYGNNRFAGNGLFRSRKKPIAIHPELLDNQQTLECVRAHAVEYYTEHPRAAKSTLSSGAQLHGIEKLIIQRYLLIDAEAYILTLDLVQCKREALQIIEASESKKPIPKSKSKTSVRPPATTQPANDNHPPANDNHQVAEIKFGQQMLAFPEADSRENGKRLTMNVLMDTPESKPLNQSDRKQAKIAEAVEESAALKDAADAPQSGERRAELFTMPGMADPREMMAQNQALLEPTDHVEFIPASDMHLAAKSCRDIAELERRVENAALAVTTSTQHVTEAVNKQEQHVTEALNKQKVAANKLARLFNHSRRRAKPAKDYCKARSSINTNTKI